MRSTVESVISSLKIANSLTVGEILLAKGLYSTLQSARVNAQKKLNELVAQGALERGNGFYRALGCKSEYKEHAQLLTKSLAELFKIPVQPFIHREITIPEVGLRPDAICLITKDNRGLCLVLECLINETESYLSMKQNTWNNWDGATGYLSQLFGYSIPHFEIVPITTVDNFKSYLKEVL